MFRYVLAAESREDGAESWLLASSTADSRLALRYSLVRMALRLGWVLRGLEDFPEPWGFVWSSGISWSLGNIPGALFPRL